MVTQPGPQSAPRVRAPALRGRGWLNTGGADVTLASLRGKILLLDFWTFCCVNCLHVLDELRPLEDKYADVLVVIGVHSPKFAHERDPEALRAAVERYGVRHPVLDDPDLTTWNQYAVRAWPTLAVVDPEGYLVATMAGEGHAEGLGRLLAQLVTEHESKGTLRRGEGPYLPPKPEDTALRFPSKALVTPGGILVADTARHSLVELASDGETLLRRIGSGSRGRADGGPGSAQFNEPQGMCPLPTHVAEHVGYDVVVADTANHLLRGLRLDTGEVTTVCGTGRQWRSTVDFRPHDVRAADLSSPWDVAWYHPTGHATSVGTPTGPEEATPRAAPPMGPGNASPDAGRVIVAMAGIHQLWWFDPLAQTTGVYAGTTVEGLRDGPLREVFLAQPSGLAVTPDGTRLWFVDAETSALRYVESGIVYTAVGTGLFDFGHRDGPGDRTLMQHPLGLVVLPDGSVAVADTYNGAIRRYDPATREMTTLASGLAEPSDLVLVDGEPVVVESAAHRLARPELSGPGKHVGGQRHHVERPPSEVNHGELTLEVVFTPPPGQKLDWTFGSPVRLEITANPPDLILDGAGTGDDLIRRLVIADGVPDGVLEVVAQVATCDQDTDHGACHLVRQDWGVPLRIRPTGPRRLELTLYGTPR